MNDKRPMYETPESLAREIATANKVASTWGCDAIKLPIRYGLDYAFVKGKTIVAFVELKSVNYTMDDFKLFGGFGMGLHKWLSAKAICESSGKPFCLIVETSDNKIWYVEYSKFEIMPTVLGGRHDRNDRQDIDPWVIINTYNFNEIK
jgi:hypothetical protein